MKKKKPLAAVEPYLWLLPSILLMTIFILFPIFEVFRTSMSEVSKAGLVKGFCGFDNFAKVLKGSTFKMVLKNTLVWTVAVVVISTVFGFILALVLNNKFRFRKAVRAIVVFPWATSLIIQAGVWKFIIDKDYGALNTLLLKLGLISSPVNWTPTPEAYFAWEIFVGIFVTVPFVTFCVLSGLQSIDNSYYEAATVDGANYWQKLFKITLPLLTPTIFFNLVMQMINGFLAFTQCYIITQGKPMNSTLLYTVYMYQQSFEFYNTGYGAAMAWVMLLMIGLITLFLFATKRFWVYEGGL